MDSNQKYDKSLALKRALLGAAVGAVGGALLFVFAKFFGGWFGMTAEPDTIIKGAVTGFLSGGGVDYHAFLGSRDPGPVETKDSGFRSNAEGPK